jgi:hypothetical protein
MAHDIANTISRPQTRESHNPPFFGPILPRTAGPNAHSSLAAHSQPFAKLLWKGTETHYLASSMLRMLEDVQKMFFPTGGVTFGGAGRYEYS